MFYSVYIFVSYKTRRNHFKMFGSKEEEYFSIFLKRKRKLRLRGVFSCFVQGDKKDGYQHPIQRKELEIINEIKYQINKNKRHVLFACVSLLFGEGNKTTSWLLTTSP